MQKTIDTDENGIVYTYYDDFVPFQILTIKENDQLSHQIDLEMGFDDDLEEWLENLDLEVSGYTFQYIFHLWIQENNPEFLDWIENFDSENSTFVAYLDSEEHLLIVAQALLGFTQKITVFKKFVRKHLEILKEIDNYLG